MIPSLYEFMAAEVPLSDVMFALAVVGMILASVKSWGHDRMLRKENLHLYTVVAQNNEIVRSVAGRLERLENLAMSGGGGGGHGFRIVGMEGVGDDE